MRARATEFPHGLTATATHDTKRGEDARSRLFALSELADEWARHVGEWRKLNEGLITASDASRSPSPAHEYMLYQALLGGWPLSGVTPDLVTRMQAYAVKAAREGKQQTSWLAPNEAYEAGLDAFLARLLDRNASADFLASFDRFAHRVALMGVLNSLTQVTLKTMGPGVPDFCQGTELWDLSLVDPDNRRPVDFVARAAALSEIEQPNWHGLASEWPDGRIKFALTRCLLALRRQMPSVFAHGEYRPLDVVGSHHDEIVAFARTRGPDAVVVVAGRLFARVTDNGQHWPSARAWDAAVRVTGFSAIKNVLAADRSLSGPELPVAELFDALPIAILPAQYVGAKREIFRKSDANYDAPTMAGSSANDLTMRSGAPGNRSDRCP
jgi:(1->4)-alpha-D-glucan 1-alpha-D-glucosylmutase